MCDCTILLIQITRGYARKSCVYLYFPFAIKFLKLNVSVRCAHLVPVKFSIENAIDEYLCCINLTEDIHLTQRLKKCHLMVYKGEQISPDGNLY
jgi:hypothetical protein